MVFEYLADETFGSPVGHHDAARRPANPDQLSRNKFWPRRQHRTDEARHEVERCVGKIQRLCIAFLKAHINVGSRNRDLPCVTTHVEHARTRRHRQAGQKLERTWLQISA